MSDFTMPSLGADMEDGTLVEWLVKPGDKVRKGDIVAVVETQKGAIDVEIFEDGVIGDLCVSEGQNVPVGTPLAHIHGAGEKEVAAPPVPSPPAPVPPKEHPRSKTQGPKPAAPPPPVPAGRNKVTPVARRLAAEHGIDPEAVIGTGVDGSVTLADVELARAHGAAARAEGKGTKRGTFDPAEMRKAIAGAMSRSKREIPHYYLANTIDLSSSLAWLADFNAARTPNERLLLAVLLLKACALALAKHPQLNGFWQDGVFVPGDGVHVGWAISLRGGGLVAPSIHDADVLALPDLMVRLRDVVARARNGALRSSDLMHATVTVTSLGDRGADLVTGVIYPPQVAIIGFGRVRERPWVVDGKVVARPLVDVTLAADHRASDGHAGGLLLSTIEQLLQEPEKL